MWFVHNPGLKVTATPYDAKGLIKAAIRDNNPCIFFEHKYLYRRIKGEVPRRRVRRPHRQSEHRPRRPRP